MKESQKSKKIKKQSKTQISPNASPFKGKRSSKKLYGKTHSYQINPKPIYMRQSKKSWVSILQSSDGHQYIGKFIPSQKQQQVISEIYFLTKLKGQNICNLVDLIKDTKGYWIVMEKGSKTLLSYLDTLQSQNINLILKNIAISYLCFYKDNIAHRDLKLSNMIICQDLSVKFIDLQLCQKNDHMYGTENYLPPEIKQIRWNSCDAYAYGMIAKNMCQRCNFQDQNIQRLIKNCLKQTQVERWTWGNIYDFWNISINNNLDKFSIMEKSVQLNKSVAQSPVSAQESYQTNKKDIN